MPIKANTNELPFDPAGDLDVNDFKNKMNNKTIIHYDNELFKESIPGWDLNSPGSEDTGETGSSEEDPVGDIEDPVDDIEDPVDDIEDPVDDIEDPVDDIEDPVDDIDDPNYLTTNNVNDDGEQETGETLPGETLSEGTGETDPELLADLIAKGVDPTLIAHLQRYANDVASGREPPPDLVAAIKALGVEDPDAKIAELGIVGGKTEDPALTAHMARYEGYKAAGEEVPPDLVAAIEAAGGSIEETTNEGGVEDLEDDGSFTPEEGAEVVGLLRTLLANPEDSEAAARLAELGIPATFLQEPDLGTIARLLGAPAFSAADEASIMALFEKAGVTMPDDFLTTPLDEADLDLLTTAIEAAPGATAPDDVEDPEGASGGDDVGVLTSDEAVEVIGLLRGLLQDPMDLEAAERLAELGIPITFPMEPDFGTVARLLGVAAFSELDEEGLKALFTKAGVTMPDDLFKGPLDEEDLDILEEAAEAAPGAEGESEE